MREVWDVSPDGQLGGGTTAHGLDPSACSARRPRAGELGITIGDQHRGRLNAITDVPGVRVGHVTLNHGAGRLVVGQGPIRTGVTVVLPHSGNVFDEPVFAGHHWLSGNGEMTGTAWMAESGLLSSPIGLTNSGSVGVVRDALAAIQAERSGQQLWTLPVVAETWDGVLNDINGQHVRAEHVRTAYRQAQRADTPEALFAQSPVPEGNVGGGTGMICHGFKAGIGTSSRTLSERDGGWTVGVLVQANHGLRRRLTILGVPVGEFLDDRVVPLPTMPEAPLVQGAGSIITLVATDAPLSPRQCTKLAQRSTLAIGRTGGAGEHDSGDGTLVFSTAAKGLIPNPGYASTPGLSYTTRMLSDDALGVLSHAVIDATEEAILNALLAGSTMAGRDDVVAFELPTDALLDVLGRFNRGPRAPGGRTR